MNEEAVIEQLRSSGTDIVFSLPCDKNKRLTDMLHDGFRTIDITREEDAVGLCAGTALMGRRAVVSIQSSGLGNMLNAMMSLTACYRLPLFVLASWRGTESERIEAQIPFNSRIPELLEVYGIGCRIVETADDIHLVGEAMEEAFDGSRMNVVLIKPELWEGSKRLPQEYPPRRHPGIRPSVSPFEGPVLTRIEAISEVMSAIDEGDIVVSNIGVPSKEVYASKDRDLNFYMLGSYTQATPIGFGVALFADRRVIVIDGDGSILGSSFLPVLASVRPDNLTVVCLDNGTFGSTGNQIDPAYTAVDLFAVASAYGLPRVERACDGGSIRSMVSERGCTVFVHVPIRVFNSDSPNIPLKAVEIRDRFMTAVGRKRTVEVDERENRMSVNTPYGIRGLQRASEHGCRDSTDS